MRASTKSVARSRPAKQPRTGTVPALEVQITVHRLVDMAARLGAIADAFRRAETPVRPFSAEEALRRVLRDALTGEAEALAELGGRLTRLITTPKVA